MTNAGEDVKEREASHTIYGSINYCNHCGNQNGDASKAKNRPT
jgi:hypothetical protein